MRAPRNAASMRSFASWSEYCSLRVFGTIMTSDSDDPDPKNLDLVFQATVGQGISAWSAMEDYLVGVASVLLGTTPHKTGLILYSIQNFYIWLNIIDELFTLETEYKDKREDWTKISGRLRELNDLRVHLAHHTSWHKDRKTTPHSLMPGRFDTRSKSLKYAPLQAPQILGFTDGIVDVTDQLEELFKEISSRYVSSLHKLLERLRDLPPEDAQWRSLRVERPGQPQS
jgi:hypothetical protein